MRKSFITYFEPFGGRDTNASKEIVTSLVTNFEVKELPVSWRRVLPIIDEMLKDDPEYIFLFGEAASYQDVTVELVGRNICSHTDNDGESKDEECIYEGMPEEIYTNFNVEGISYRTSINAGKYLCNYVYYNCLLKKQVTKVIVIYVPYLDENNKKEDVLKKVEDSITFLMDNDDNYLIRLNGKAFTLTKNNAYDSFEMIQKEHNLPNIIINIDRMENGYFVMTGSLDGHKGIWYEYGYKKKDEPKLRQSLYYKIICFYYE